MKMGVCVAIAVIRASQLQGQGIELAAELLLTR